MTRPSSTLPGGDVPADPVAHDGRMVSETEYWRDWYDPGDISYEWNRGQLEERPVPDFETFQVYAWLVDLLRHYLRVQPIGKLVALEMGFRFRIDDLNTRPDLEAMRRDPVYADFVVPEWTQVEQERERALQARDRLRRERDAALASQRQEAAAREALEQALARLRAGRDRSDG